MYLADFLRSFATGLVDGLLLDEGQAPAADLPHPDGYRPVLNLADHYEWPVLVCSETTAAWPHGAVTGVAGWIGSEPPERAAATLGSYATAEFCAGADPTGGPDLVLAAVPAHADPESVTARVRALS